MIPSCLNFPDHTSDQRSFAYSPHVAQALYRAYSHVQQKQLGSFEANLLPLLMQPMTPAQRMRLLYVLSLAALRNKVYAAALDYADAGLEIAHRQGDAGSSAILARMAGIASHNLQKFRFAYNHYLHVMSALGDLKSLPQNNLDRFDILRRLAINTFLLARYSEAAQYLQYAREIASQYDNMKLDVARLDWLDALVYRWHRQPFSAVRAIQSAAITFEASADQFERGRFHIAYAEVALECVEYIQGISDNKTFFLHLVEHHVTDGLSDVLETQDIAGKGLALLAQARFARLAHRNEDDQSTLDKVEMIADQLQDAPLLAQTHTARGDAFAERDEISSALTCYRMAIDALAESDSQAYKLRPQRSLWTLQEMRN